MSIMEMQVGLSEQGMNLLDFLWCQHSVAFPLWEEKAYHLYLIHRKVGTLRGNCPGVSLGQSGVVRRRVWVKTPGLEPFGVGLPRRQAFFPFRQSVTRLGAPEGQGE